MHAGTREKSANSTGGVCGGEEIGLTPTAWRKRRVGESAYTTPPLEKQKIPQHVKVEGFKVVLLLHADTAGALTSRDRRPVHGTNLPGIFFFGEDDGGAGHIMIHGRPSRHLFGSFGVEHGHGNFPGLDRDDRDMLGPDRVGLDGRKTFLHVRGHELEKATT